MGISTAMVAVTILKYTGLLCLLILCASAVCVTLRFCISNDFRARIIWSFPLPFDIKRLFERKDSLTSSYYHYVSEVRPDHEAVVSRILNCMKVKDRRTLPDDVGNLLYPEGYSFTGDRALEAGTRLPTREEHSILQLSNTIMTYRIQLMGRVARSFRFWQITSLASILLGMLTTIIVSTSTTDFGKDVIAIRILSIVFPALSTAAAAAFAFYGPQATWSQATRTLTSLSQLHGQMGLEVWDIECVDDGAPNPKLTAALSGWSKRFLDIQTISAAAGQGSTQQGSGGTGTSGTGSGPMGEEGGPGGKTS